MSHIFFKKITKNININKASNDLLKKIPYIGDIRASKIIQNRPYKSKKDLLNIVGKTTYNNIKNYICVCKPKYQKYKFISVPNDNNPGYPNNKIKQIYIPIDNNQNYINNKIKQIYVRNNCDLGYFNNEINNIYLYQ